MKNELPAGVAAPEAANNAAARSGFIPMLILGIPATATLALLLGTLMMYGVQPGPMLMQKAPDIFRGTITKWYW